MTKKSVIALLALAVVGMLGVAFVWLRPQPQPVETTDYADERAALAASNGLARRDGDALELKLKGGQALRLTDRVKCGDLPCPSELATRYRYLGWSSAAGGYRLSVSPSSAPEMILPFADDDAVLVDSRHAETPADGAMPLPPPPPPTDADQTMTDWLADVAQGRDQSETPLIAASNGAARRDGSTLSIRLADGRHLTLTDDLACGQASCPPQIFRSFDYAGSGADNRYQVVVEHWDEANAALLIDTRTGNVFSLLGVPQFSPDSRHIVDSVVDLEWSAPRRLEVWALNDGVPGMEFSLPAKIEDDTIYEIVGWEDADRVRLKRGPWTSDQRSDALLVHDAGGWHLESGEGGN